MNKRILIVDDDKDMLQMLRVVFQGAAFDVVLSDTGMNLKQIELVDADLIIPDVQIKGCKTTGDEICREIKSQPRLLHIPVLLSSSEAELQSLANAGKADGYFTKPFDLLKLRTEIGNKLC